MKTDTAIKNATTPSRRARGQVQEEVFQHIRRGLIVGVFLPGETMSLRKLANRFGTSPMPVRAALTRLVVTNALEEAPNGTVRVPRLTGDRLTELFAVRRLLEGMATEAACRHVTPELLETLTKQNDELLAALDRREAVACLSANQRFHFTLYEAAKSTVLMPLIESLWLQFGPTMYLSLDSTLYPWDATAHFDILQGLKDNNPELARKGILKDIEHTGRALKAASDEPDMLTKLSGSDSDLYFGQ